MLRYIVSRLVQLVVISFIISVLAFLLVHLLPGDPTITILGPNDTAHSPAVLLHQLGLNKPLVGPVLARGSATCSTATWARRS